VTESVYTNCTFAQFVEVLHVLTFMVVCRGYVVVYERKSIFLTGKFCKELSEFTEFTYSNMHEPWRQSRLCQRSRPRPVVSANRSVDRSIDRSIDHDRRANIGWLLHIGRG